jgi:Secretion system C-terminal sorting domain
MENFKRFILFMVYFNLTVIYISYGQGKNSHFLLGYDTGLFDTNVVSTKADLYFTQNNYTLTPANFKMPFRAAQANLSDENGNLLMVSNGCWIADATGDTMQNGGGLIPNSYTANWCNLTKGIPYPHSAVFVPDPSDSNKIYLLHQSGTNSSNFKSSGLYYSIVDKTLNGGLGGVVLGQKNQVALQAGLNPGIAVCKHANGIDWWVVVFKDSSDIVYTMQLSATGFSTPIQQALGVSPPVYLLGQMSFSPDGRKFAYSYFDGTFGATNNYIRLFDFDRCTGLFSNKIEVVYIENYGGLGLSFSPDSKKLYAGTFIKIVQLNLDTTNITASLDTVAVYDGYGYPHPLLKTDFWLMYLAANGKIYLSSGNSVIDMHYINYPDSNGIACDFRQHAIRLPCFAWRGNVYHPNYYLGCDTTLGCPCLVTGINEHQQHDFRFSLSPNPASSFIKIMYLLPQNKSGVLDVYNLQGQLVFHSQLPPWSTLQQFNLSFLSDGMYQCVLKSDGYSVSKKLVLMR